MAEAEQERHAGDQEVAIITVIHQTIMLWDSDGNGLIDCAVELRTSAMPQDYVLEDFI